SQGSTSNRRPEKVFRIVYVSASVFTREVSGDGETRTLRSVKLQKRYVDGSDVKYTDSFSLPELPQVQRVLELATSWVEQHEAELDFS
ncbi:MAG: hypothetical protein KDA96_11105, partial [Planctomycetaceae bacterium]|nr:hypothetical protein [Planctomycetaceae bacterium]